MIYNGNKSTGGMRNVGVFEGIFGIARFIKTNFLILISKKSEVALLGGRYIYHIDDTVCIKIFPQNLKNEWVSEDQRYEQIFGQVDIHKNFYFSYHYDITQSLQHNLSHAETFNPNSMFVWNDNLMRPIDQLDNCWKIPIIHGFVDQSEISVFGHGIFVTLIARRSRHFAGARFLKRGVNDQGYVANDVETEQIVNDASTTFFPSSSSSKGSGYTSFLQHRGSIPLYWSQDQIALSAKPNINVDLIDPYYTSTAKHFDNLFARYGSPIIVLNLIKAKERIKRESILLNHFSEAIQYLNQSLPEENKIKLISWDMARASKR
jgi:hypothetical protein